MQEGVKIRCCKYFNLKYSRDLRADTLYILGYFIDGERLTKVKRQNPTVCVSCLSGEATVYSVSAPGL